MRALRSKRQICRVLSFFNRSFSVTWSAALQIAWNKRKFNSHSIFFVHKHGSRFIVLYIYIWPRDVMWKQSIRLCVLEFGVNPKCRTSPKIDIDGIFRFTPPKSGKSALGMRLMGEYPSGHVTGCANGSCWPIMLRSFSTGLYTHNEIQAKYFSSQIRG